MKVVLCNCAVHASISFGCTRLCPSVIFFISCVPNHTVHTILLCAPALIAVLFVAIKALVYSLL